MQIFPVLTFLYNSTFTYRIMSIDAKVTKKKKKKTKVEVQDAEDVKKLPDEIIPSSRPGTV